MSGADEFYRLRDQRSAEYGAGLSSAARAIHIMADTDVVQSRAGQVVLLSLLNQLSRGFRRITVDLPDAAVAIPTLVPADSVRSAVLATMVAIDPFGEFGLGERPAPDSLIVGIGANLRSAAHWYLGASGAVGYLSTIPIPIRDTRATLLGAGIAACVGAAAVWRTALRLPVRPLSLSLETMREGTDGAELVDFGGTDLGRVLMIGAGAVANALTYWAPLFDVTGTWDILDRDKAALHNTNRGLCLLPAHTEWVRATPMYKADVLADYLPAARSLPHWYHEAPDLDPRRYDLILPLANDHDVRQLVANTGHPTILHATTGRNWNALLHRHLGGMDDCIQCRMQGQPVDPAMQCSTAIVPTATGGSRDAALPFLSAGAGLLLARALMRLGDGSLRNGSVNRWSWFFDFGRRVNQCAVSSCHACSTSLPETVRNRLYGQTLWHSRRDPPGETSSARDTV